MALSFRLVGEMEAPPPKAWLAENWFGAADQVVVRGAPGSGKSTLIARLVASVATSRPWLGISTAQGAVLWIALERKDDTLRNLHALLENTKAPIAVTSDAMDLTSSSAAADVIDACRRLERQTGLPTVGVVIDTLSRAIAGADENSAAAMSIVMRSCATVSEATSATVILLHHENKSGGTRGSTAIDAAADCVIEVSCSGRRRVAQIVKANAAPIGSELAFQIMPASGGLVAVADGAPTRHDCSGLKLPPKVAALLSLIESLARTGTVSRRDLVQEACQRKVVFGGNVAETVRKYLRMLSDAKVIEYTDTTVSLLASPSPTDAPPPLRGGGGCVGGVAQAHMRPTDNPQSAHSHPTEPTEQPHRNTPQNSRKKPRPTCGVDGRDGDEFERPVIN